MHSRNSKPIHIARIVIAFLTAVLCVLLLVSKKSKAAPMNIVPAKEQLVVGSDIDLAQSCKKGYPVFTRSKAGWHDLDVGHAYVRAACNKKIKPVNLGPLY